MQTEVYETGMNGCKTVLATVDSFAEAEAFVTKLGIQPGCFEVDEDYEGCADAFLTDGRIIAIQPVGFKL